MQMSWFHSLLNRVVLRRAALVVSVPSLMEKEKVLFISMRIYEPLSPSMFSRFWSAFSAFIHRAMVKGLSESPASSG